MFQLAEVAPAEVRLDGGAYRKVVMDIRVEKGYEVLGQQFLKNFLTSVWQ